MIDMAVAFRTILVLEFTSPGREPREMESRRLPRAKTDPRRRS